MLVFAAVLVVKPWHYANPLYRYPDICFCGGLAVCNLFRSRFCRLIVTGQEIEFHDGLLNEKTHFVSKTGTGGMEPGDSD